MSLSIFIPRLYPTAICDVDYRVEDNGTGAKIVLWNVVKLGPQPTTETVLVNGAAAPLSSEENMRLRLEQAITYLKNLPNPLNPDGSIATPLTANQVTKSIWAIRRVLKALAMGEI